MPEPVPLRISSPLPAPAPPNRVPEPEENLTPEEARELRMQVDEYRRTITDLRAQEARVEDIERENRELHELVESLKHERDKLIPKRRAFDKMLQLATRMVEDIEQTLEKLEQDRALYTNMLEHARDLLNDPNLRLSELQHSLSTLSHTSREASAIESGLHKQVFNRVNIQVEKFKQFVDLLEQQDVSGAAIHELNRKYALFRQKLAELASFYSKVAQ
jgi:chromosome segregation ATPase